MTAPDSLPLHALAEENRTAASPDLLRAMIKTFADALMSAEADALCNAEYGQVSDERVNHRNGYRQREWDTRAGTVELAVPKLRQGSYFPHWLLERRRRAEQALISVVATAYPLGVSIRRVEKLAASLGVTQLSKSQVSAMAKHLDEQVAAFRNRPPGHRPVLVRLGRRTYPEGPRRRPHHQRPRADRGRRQCRRPPRDPRHRRRHRRRRRRLARFPALPDRPRPVRRPVRHLRRPRRPGGRDRRGPARRLLAALPHPLRKNLAEPGAEVGPALRAHVGHVHRPWRPDALEGEPGAGIPGPPGSPANSYPRCGSSGGWSSTLRPWATTCW